MRSTGKTEHVSALTAMLYPGYTEHCQHCGGFVAISPEEALRRTFEAAYQPWAALAKAMEQATATPATGLPSAPTPATTDWASEWMRALTGYTHHQHRHHHRKHDCGCDDGCGCEPCTKDDCHCRCCIVNADLVVYARLGERRLVPLTLENSRRRERQIKLELSEFNSKGGSPSGVTGRLLSPAEFTLASCEQREVLVGIEVGEERGEEESPRRKRREGATRVGAAPEGEPKEEAESQTEGRKLPDVDECRVAYADLRVVGCDNRPIRIAVATLPRDCHDYRIDCGSACCW